MPILTKFRMKRHLVLVYSYTTFELNNSKFQKLHNLEKIFKKFKIKKFERSNRFWPNLMSKVLDRCIIFLCNYRTIT